MVGGNEAGMLLGGEVRGADASIWLAAPRPAQGGFARSAPILAVAIVGDDEPVDALFAKASWYLAHAVEVVWIVAPPTRSVHVVDARGKTETTDRIPARASLPGLEPAVADFFRQL